MSSRGAFGERLAEAWIELRENPGRSFLQALGVMLGVAAVLGGFAISDSQRRQSDRVFARTGGIDKLNVLPTDVARRDNPSALESANRGLSLEDAVEGGEIPGARAVNATSVLRQARARVRSEAAEEERQVSGIGADYAALNGYEVREGRGFSSHDFSTGAPVAVLGSEVARVFFPLGGAVGQTLRVGELPVTVIGVYAEKNFRFRKGQRNIFAWRNRLLAVPSLLVAARMEGDDYHRLDRVTFRVPDLAAMADFSRELRGLVTANHRLQEDFRLDNVAKRIEKQRSQGDVYNIIFLLSGVLALLGGGMVNVNVQLASLKERVREVGVKMALGAPGKEIFKAFMTEALLLTVLGSLAGFALGLAFSWGITRSIGVPLALAWPSFLWAALLAFSCGFLFALYPAAKASRQSPMEALRYE